RRAPLANGAPTMRCAVLPLLLWALVPPTGTNQQGEQPTGTARQLPGGEATGAAKQPQGGQPTPEQLQAAKDAFAKAGDVHKEVFDQPTNRTIAVFVMLESTKDADLKGLPDLPFGFGLSLGRTKVTDAGLKELKDLKQLTWLDLEGHLLKGNGVTDTGLKELKD